MALPLSWSGSRANAHTRRCSTTLARGPVHGHPSARPGQKHCKAPSNLTTVRSSTRTPASPIGAPHAGHWFCWAANSASRQRRQKACPQLPPVGRVRAHTQTSRPRRRTVPRSDEHLIAVHTATDAVCLIWCDIFQLPRRRHPRGERRVCGSCTRRDYYCSGRKCVC